MPFYFLSVKERTLDCGRLLLCELQNLRLAQKRKEIICWRIDGSGPGFLPHGMDKELQAA